ncbi:MAG: UPF0280 family protein [Rhizobiales bacterium]|nr:UPF0280 family protein [Hyphomicrobiales bacterium]
MAAEALGLMTRATARMIGDRLHLQDGPIDLIIGAEGSPEARLAAFASATQRFATILDELCSELPLLRSGARAESPPSGSVAHAMWRAVLPYAADTFITPMAAVAGAVADEILRALLAPGGLTRAYVNNGGDIALHLSPGTSWRIGLVDRPDRPSLFAATEIAAADPVRGIATSGWRGRSFSLGIADAVTVLAADAATADAAATVVANAVDLPGHPAVMRIPATDLQPDSDLGSRPVTRAVSPLSREDVRRALDSGRLTAESLASQGRLTAVSLHLAGETLVVGSKMSEVLLSSMNV